MMVSAEPISAFVHQHPTVKMLALSFLLLIGMSLLLEGFGQHIPEGLHLLRDGLLGLRRDDQPAAAAEDGARALEGSLLERTVSRRLQAAIDKLAGGHEQWPYARRSDSPRSDGEPRRRGRGARLRRTRPLRLSSPAEPRRRDTYPSASSIPARAPSATSS